MGNIFFEIWENLSIAKETGSIAYFMSNIVNILESMKKYSNVGVEQRSKRLLILVLDLVKMLRN